MQVKMIFDDDELGIMTAALAGLLLCKIDPKDVKKGKDLLKRLELEQEKEKLLKKIKDLGIISISDITNIDTIKDAIAAVEETNKHLDFDKIAKEIDKDIKEVEEEKKVENKCHPCKFNTVGQDEYIRALEEQNEEHDELEWQSKKLFEDISDRIEYALETMECMQQDLREAVTNIKEFTKED